MNDNCVSAGQIITKSNPLPLICYLDLSVATEPGNLESDCVCTLRIGEDEFVDQGVTYQVAISKAMIQLDLHGFTVVEGTRYGEPTAPNAIEATSNYKKVETTNREGRASGSAGGSLDFDGCPAAELSGKLSGSAGAGLEVVATAERSETTQLLRVRARGGDYWEVSDFDVRGQSIFLNKTFLTNEVLCQLAKATKANRNTVVAVLTVRKRDIDLRVSPDESFGLIKRFTTNKEKVLKAITAKAIGKLSFSNFDDSGRVIISGVEVECEES